MLRRSHISEFASARRTAVASEGIGDRRADDVSRLHYYTRQAISASAALTSASIPDQKISNAQYAHLDHAAYEARRLLLECLKRDHNIDAAMADKLGALL